MRFIPTRAGNIAPEASRINTLSVHPHTRGEHVIISFYVGRKIGSSPHARGTCATFNRQHNRNRFIPTRAGNMSRGRGIITRITVHPHTRGEHKSPNTVCSCRSGSSPHARGTYAHPVFPGRCGRFIPTRAGNISARAWPNWSRTVHPHTRGEHLMELNAEMLKFGSSPHARGTYQFQRPAFGRLRFIPTRAGNISLNDRPSAR